MSNYSRVSTKYGVYEIARENEEYFLYASLLPSKKYKTILVDKMNITTKTISLTFDGLKKEIKNLKLKTDW